MAGRGGPGRPGGRLRGHRPDGPPDPDPSGRPRVGGPAGAVRRPRPARRRRARPAARHPGLAALAAGARAARQGAGHARRALRWRRVLRRRSRLVGARARGVRRAVPAAGRAVATCSAAGIETMRALWRPGTAAYSGELVDLPETTCYPRPLGPLPVIVGGRGPRLLDIAARLGDACNLPSDPVAARRRHRDVAGGVRGRRPGSGRGRHDRARPAGRRPGPRAHGRAGRAPARPHVGGDLRRGPSRGDRRPTRSGATDSWPSSVCRRRSSRCRTWPARTISSGSGRSSRPWLSR